MVLYAMSAHCKWKTKILKMQMYSSVHSVTYLFTIIVFTLNRVSLISYVYCGFFGHPAIRFPEVSGGAHWHDMKKIGHSHVGRNPGQKSWAKIVGKNPGQKSWAKSEVEHRHQPIGHRHSRY